VDNKLEMLSRQNDLIVKGIPALNNEKTLIIYHKIAAAIGLSAKTAPLVQIHRLGKKKAWNQDGPTTTCQVYEF
jgi:hypothetical protein